jgi:hypothetical protein
MHVKSVVSAASIKGSDALQTPALEGSLKVLGE